MPYIRKQLLDYVSVCVIVFDETLIITHKSGDFYRKPITKSDNSA